MAHDCEAMDVIVDCFSFVFGTIDVIRELENKEHKRRLTCNKLLCFKELCQEDESLQSMAH